MKQKRLIALVTLFLTCTVYADTHESVDDVMKADANHDSKVSFEEYKAAHEAKMKARFERKDVNGDGYIDLEEKKVAVEERKAQKEAEKKIEKEKLREKLSEDRKKRKKHFYKYK